MTATSIGPLRVVIGGDATDLNRTLTTAERSVAAFGRQISALRSLAMAAGITVATVALARLAQQSWNTIDSQSELAYRIGGTISGVQTLAAVAAKAGVESEQLSKSVGKMSVALAEAARTGAGPAYEALRRVGLSAADLLKLDIDQRLAVIADRFKELGLTTAQQGEVLRAFGIRGQEMINIFEGGGDALRNTRKDLVAFGVALSAIDGTKVEQADDALKEAKLALTGVANQIAVALSPLVNQLATDFANAGRQTGGFREQIDALLHRGVRVIAFFDELSTRSKSFDLGAYVRGLAGDLMDAISGTRVIREEIGKPPPFDEWDRWFGLLKLKAEMNAKALADARANMLGTGGPKQDPLSEEQRKQLELRFVALQRSLASEAAALDYRRQEELLKLQEFNEKQIGSASERQAALLAIEAKYQDDRRNLVFSKLIEGVATEDEILAKKHADQLKAIAEFEAARTITENQAAALRKKFAEKSALDLLQLQTRQYASLATIVDTAMGNISQIVGKEGGAAFEVMKALSMATALVKGSEAIVSAWATGNATGIPGAGAVAAAVTAAGVAAQIATIARTKPGSAGTVTAPAAAAPAAAESAGGGGGSPAGGTLTVQGIDPSVLFSGEAVRALAQRLLQFQRDGGQVVLA